MLAASAAESSIASQTDAKRFLFIGAPLAIHDTDALRARCRVALSLASSSESSAGRKRRLRTWQRKSLDRLQRHRERGFRVLQRQRSTLASSRGDPAHAGHDRAGTPLLVGHLAETLASIRANHRKTL